MEFFDDDKNLVILSILLLCLAIVFGPTLNAQAAEIIKMFGSGLLGMGVGKRLK